MTPDALRKAADLADSLKLGYIILYTAEARELADRLEALEPKSDPAGPAPAQPT